MIYTELTRKAMKLAYNAHHGQLDKSGIPYIFHPFHLAEQMKDEYTICTALLHDVVEDTNVTLKELEDIFPPVVTEAVRLLTHNKDTDYFEYVRAISTNQIARTVKIADLRHNSDKSRLDGTKNDSETLRRLEKYAKAIKLLTEGE
ncbi:HD domain-containing protein [Ruminococcus sp.]|uniref:HD domain-containing protein n=1 Tax=Ruminococcus sp. TaxID=41978 RepID=UPI001B6E2687|nr:HD domain-containing protein [Ruminococcus sp.]MBP5432837.1 HD domain-containing protein [Ruminococcus sp.]